MIPQVAVNRRFLSVRLTVGNRSAVLDIPETRTLMQRLQRALARLDDVHPDEFEDVQ